MISVFKVFSIASLFMSIGITSVLAGEGQQALSPAMLKYSEEYKKIYDNKELSAQEKASSMVKIAKKYNDNAVLATALYCAINILPYKEDKEEALAYYKELIEIKSEDSIVLKFQKELSGYPERIAALEKRAQDKITRILESDDSFEKGVAITTSWRELIKEKQLLPCIESIKSASVRRKVAFAVYDDLSANEKTNFKEAFKSIIVSAGELGAKYFDVKTAKNTNDTEIDAVRKEIWNVDDIDRDTMNKAFSCFTMGLSMKQDFWPPFLSSEDKIAYDKHIAKLENSYHIVNKAIEYISQSKNVFYRKDKEYSGAKLALHLQVKLPLLKKHPGLYGKPLETMDVLTQTTSSTIVGGLSNHLPVDKYKVKTDEGEIVNVFPWVLKNMDLSENEKKLIAASQYSYVLK